MVLGKSKTPIIWNGNFLKNYFHRNRKNLMSTIILINKQPTNIFCRKFITITKIYFEIALAYTLSKSELKVLLRNSSIDHGQILRIRRKSDRSQRAKVYLGYQSSWKKILYQKLNIDFQDWLINRQWRKCWWRGEPLNREPKLTLKPITKTHKRLRMQDKHLENP